MSWAGAFTEAPGEQGRHTVNDPTKGSIYSDEFLVMEREVSKLRRECVRLASELQAVVPLLREAEAKLVERDVYEAQQILPPEQATLIKHLATVERCIEHGRLKGYDLEDRWCVFCEEYMDDHTKDCAWLALQFDRKPAETMAMVEGWAWDEDARRDRERARAMTPQRPGRNTMTGLSEWLKNTWAIERVQDVTPGGAGLRGHISVIAGRRAQQQVWPALLQWLKDHDD